MSGKKRNDGPVGAAAVIGTPDGDVPNLGGTMPLPQVVLTLGPQGMQIELRDFPGGPVDLMNLLHQAALSVAINAMKQMAEAQGGGNGGPKVVRASGNVPRCN